MVKRGESVVKNMNKKDIARFFMAKAKNRKLDKAYEKAIDLDDLREQRGNGWRVVHICLSGSTTCLG